VLSFQKVAWALIPRLTPVILGSIALNVNVGGFMQRSP